MPQNCQFGTTLSLHNLREMLHVSHIKEGVKNNLLLSSNSFPPIPAHLFDKSTQLFAQKDSCLSKK